MIITHACFLVVDIGRFCFNSLLSLYLLDDAYWQSAQEHAATRVQWNNQVSLSYLIDMNRWTRFILSPYYLKKMQPREQAWQNWVWKDCSGQLYTVKRQEVENKWVAVFGFYLSKQIPNEFENIKTQLFNESKAFKSIPISNPYCDCSCCLCRDKLCLTCNGRLLGDALNKNLAQD